MSFCLVIPNGLAILADGNFTNYGFIFVKRISLTQYICNAIRTAKWLLNNIRLQKGRRHRHRSQIVKTGAGKIAGLGLYWLPDVEPAYSGEVASKSGCGSTALPDRYRYRYLPLFSNLNSKNRHRMGFSSVQEISPGEISFNS